MKIINEFIGWYGAIVILLAYSFLSFDILTSKSFLYQFF